MMCNCIQEISEEIINKCNKDNMFGSDVISLEFTDVKKSDSIGLDYPQFTTNMKIKLSGTKRYKNIPNFITYCPFCGVKYPNKDLYK